jgi:hypothetical protein
VTFSENARTLNCWKELRLRYSDSWSSQSINFKIAILIAFTICFSFKILVFLHDYEIPCPGKLRC